MRAMQTHIAPQKLEQVQQQLGGALCRALELLTSKLHYELKMPARRYAELREAKSLIACLKYSDATESVDADSLAWALALIRESYQADACPTGVVLLDLAADMLGIDMAASHPIPADLNRKIGNELQMMSRMAVASPTLAAAA